MTTNTQLNPGEIKKIIALSCSPSKKRNSDTMLDYFIEGIKDFSGDNVVVEKVYLNDIKIDFYKYENRLGPDSSETLFSELSEKIKSCDGLIIATPTYNFSVPAQLKNFIDRIRFFALDFENRTRFGQPKGKLNYLKMYFLVSGGIPKWSEKILFFAFPAFWLRGVFLYYNAKVFGAYYSGDVKTFENQKILKKCCVLGKRYAKRVVLDKGNRILERIFWRPKQFD